MRANQHSQGILTPPQGLLCTALTLLGPGRSATATQTAALSAPYRFKVASKLGQGAFADVLCVKDAEHNQQLAALKVLKPPPAALPAGLALPGAPVQRMTSFNSPGAQAPEVSLFREARALKHSKHP
jgi:serine/threonine protein kinase